MRVLAVVVALAIVPAASAAAPLKRASLPQVARSLVKAGAPGAIVYVRAPTAARSGTAGYADVAARATMRARDRWRIASVSKAFVSTVVLQLEAEGKLDIDDPVERYLPGLVPNGNAISLRELLNHTSGLFNYTDDGAFIQSVLGNPGRMWTPRELVSVAFAHAPNFAPGSNWSYSNTGYVLLGLVVEAVTGKPLAQSLQERLFTPLSLTSTSFPVGIALDDTFVHGYVSLDGPLVDVAPALDPSWAWAAGGIVSGARDVTTFYRALLSGRLLPAAQLGELEVPSAIAGTYGLGIFTTSTACGRAYGHDGDFPGYRTEVLANRRREAVVMVNVDETYVRWERLEAAVKIALCRG